MGLFSFFGTKGKQKQKQKDLSTVHPEVVAEDILSCFLSTMEHMECEYTDILSDLSYHVQERHKLALDLGSMLYTNGFIGDGESFSLATLQRYLSESDMQTLVWDYFCRATHDLLRKKLYNTLLIHPDFQKNHYDTHRPQYTNQPPRWRSTTSSFSTLYEQRERQERDEQEMGVSAVSPEDGPTPPTRRASRIGARRDTRRTRRCDTSAMRAI